jgi:hypothetical protein
MPLQAVTLARLMVLFACNGVNEPGRGFYWPRILGFISRASDRSIRNIYNLFRQIWILLATAYILVNRILEAIPAPAFLPDSQDVTCCNEAFEGSPKRSLGNFWAHSAVDLAFRGIRKALQVFKYQCPQSMWLHSRESCESVETDLSQESGWNKVPSRFRPA